MTYEAAALGAVIADIDRTIAHWISLGVRAADIGAALKCHHKWAAIKRKMIVTTMPPREIPPEATMIALIGSRKRRQLTIEDVANRLGISRRRLSHYERGARTPTVSILTSWRVAVGLRGRPLRLAA